MKGTVLVVDDERNQREILGAILKSEGYNPLLAGSGEEALKILERENVDLVLTDLIMPGMSGEELIDAVLARNAGMPIILTSAYGTIQTAVDAIKKGAYLLLREAGRPGPPPDHHRPGHREPPAPRIPPHALREARRRPRSDPGGARRAAGDQEDPAPRRQERQHGPPHGGKRHGQGSDRAQHPLAERPRSRSRSSPSTARPFPTPSSKASSSATSSGAFTGAVRREIGLFEAAEGGTIFLDEIAEVKLETQAKLLRALQEKEIRRVGGKENIPVDVRIIAATNRDLEEAVRDGRFRDGPLLPAQHRQAEPAAPAGDGSRTSPSLAEHFLGKHGRRESRPFGRSRRRPCAS